MWGLNGLCTIDFSTYKSRSSGGDPGRRSNSPLPVCLSSIRSSDMFDASKRLLSQIDPAHRELNPFDHEFTQTIWRDKYQWNNEPDIYATFARVSETISLKDPELAGLFMDAME